MHHRAHVNVRRNVLKNVSNVWSANSTLTRSKPHFQKLSLSLLNNTRNGPLIIQTAEASSSSSSSSNKFTHTRRACCCCCCCCCCCVLAAILVVAGWFSLSLSAFTHHFQYQLNSVEAASDWCVMLYAAAVKLCLTVSLFVSTLLCVLTICLSNSITHWPLEPDQITVFPPELKLRDT